MQAQTQPDTRCQQAFFATGLNLHAFARIVNAMRTAFAVRQYRLPPMPFIPSFAMLGSGPTVLMLHDADGDHLSFAPQVELLASQGYRAIAWDMPGYHHNPPPPGGYSLSALASTADHMLGTMKIGRAHIVGHGLGAMVAAEMALRYPTRVHSVTMIAGGPALDDAARQHWVATRLQLLNASLQNTSDAAALQQFATQLVQLQAGEAALPEGLQLARHTISQIQPLAYRRMLELIGSQGHNPERWSNLRQPTLMVSGGQDVCMPPTLLQTMADHMPHAGHATLTGIGHWPQLENPDGFEGLLLDFLGSQRTAVH
ncbi:MAG: alpha/beta hydrolase [Comamonas sp.]